MSSKPWSKKKPVKSAIKLLSAISGITVSPALKEIDLASQPDNFTITYSNHTDTPIQLSFHAQDFTSLEEGWRVKFLGSEDPSTYRYSLSSWLELKPPSLLLTPGKSGELEVTIRSQSLSAGGHYGSVIADITTAPPTDSGIVEIKSQLASLVFVRANTGQEREAGKISQFTTVGGNVISLPSKYLLRFENYGNVHITPHGLITIRDFLGREIARQAINLDSLPTLPETIRRYDIPVAHTSSWPFPGPYQASITVKYGSSQSIASHLQFFSFGHPVNLALIITLPFFTMIILRFLSKKMKRR